MTSIRRRTLTLIIGLMLSALLSISLFNLRDSNHEIAEIYDARMAQNARLLQGLMRLPVASQEQAQLYEAFNRTLNQADPQTDGHPYENKTAFQVWNGQAQLLVRSAGGPSLAAAPTPPGFSEIQDMDGRQWRAFVLDDKDHNLRIWVGERHDVRAELVEHIMRHTLVPNVVGSLLLVAMVWLAIGWGLKPLANMASTLRMRHSGSLEPLRLEPLPTELEPMQTALNRMLAQIQEVLDRERRFIADAAHEMRTPLAVLRVHAQNLLEAGTEQERRTSLESLILGVDRAARLVNQLLTMARLEPKAVMPPRQQVDLAQTVRESLVQLTPWILSKGLELSFDVDEAAYPVMADAAAIDIALNNLLSNAVNFSPANGVITVRLNRVREHFEREPLKREHFELSVEDQGPGIDEAEREHLFERFYSRGNVHGAGLGLTIVSTVANQMGARVSLDNLPQGGLCVKLTIAPSHR